MTAVERVGAPAHPAVFPSYVIELAAEAIWPDLVPARRRDCLVLDPFAGVGGVHALRDVGPINGRRIETVGVELMPKWAHAHPATLVGDATQLPQSWSARFDAVVTSPCYGNRMADHHENNDACKMCEGAGYLRGRVLCPTCKGSKLSHRRSYRHYYGDTFWDDAPRESNAGAMAWGDEYRALHEAAWREVLRVLRPGGRFVLNVKDHVRGGRRVRVARWHHDTCRALGFVDLWRWDVPLDGYGFGQNRAARVSSEQLYVMEKP